jgi:DNA-binding response OmpR family regulator
VVDDDERYRKMAAEPFLKRGDNVRTTSDGLEALSMCLKQPPDVILSDVQMPRMDGWQLLRLVRARPSLASVPVIFLTMLSGDSERLLGYQLGVDAYIPKPYNPDELLVRVHQIVRRARNSNSSPAARTTMRGDLEHVSVSSILSFLEMDRKTGALLLIGMEVARVFVQEGRILRAELEGRTLASRQVLHTMLEWTNGQFEFAPHDVGGNDQLGMTVTGLLLEHAQLSDEKKR